MALSRIAEAYVQVVPRIDGVATQLKGQLSGEMAAAGAVGGDALAKGTSTGFGSKIKSYVAPMAATFAATFAAVGITNFLKESVTAASDFQESANAVRVAYGQAAGDVAALSEGVATRLGLSTTEFNQAAVRFSAFAERIAGEGGNVGGVVDSLTTRAADFASVFNIDVSEALAVFSSGLAGEAEPLKRFGINLLDSEVKAFAAANGIGQVGKELTETEKVQARYGLLLESTSKTQGDFANTSDGLANQQRILAAQLEESKKKLGDQLLPAMTGLATFANDSLIPAFNNFLDGLKSVGSWISENQPVIATFVGVLTGLYTAFNAISIATKLWAVAQGILNVVMALNPFTLIAIAIAALVAGIVYLATQTTFFQDAWATMSEFVGGVWTALYDGIIKPIGDAIGAVFTFLYENVIRPVYLGIMLYIGLWAAAFEALYNIIIKPIGDLIGAVFTGLWNIIIKPVVDFIVGGFVWIGESFVSLWENVIRPGIDALGTGFEWLWTNAIKPAIDFIVGGFQFLGETIESIFEGVTGFVGDAFEGLVGIARGPINGLIDLLNGMINGLNKIKIDIPDWVPEWGGKAIGFAIPNIPKLAEGGFVNSPTTALIGEAGPEVVMPLNRFEQLMGLDGRGQTINYYAAPNQSLDAEQALFQAIKRAKVVAGW